MRVAPAWLGSPVKSNRQRPCAQLVEATATARPRSTRSRPCSTCSSTNASTSSSSDERPSLGSWPAADIASTRYVPARSRRRPASSGEMRPVASRDPRQATPNREPSSSTNSATPTGRDGTTPRSRSRSIAAKEETTPSGPSYAPPLSTESRCDPTKMPRRAPAEVAAGCPGRSAGSGGRHQATALPWPSVSTSRCRRRPPRGTRRRTRAPRSRTASAGSHPWPGHGRSAADRSTSARTSPQQYVRRQPPRSGREKHGPGPV